MNAWLEIAMVLSGMPSSKYVWYCEDIDKIFCTKNAPPKGKKTHNILKIAINNSTIKTLSTNAIYIGRL